MADAAGFGTRLAAAEPDVIAPDGSEVRVLCGLGRGGLALFTLPPGAVARPVAHRTVEELWFVVSGNGRMWRRLGGREEVVDLLPGMSVDLPTGTHFQFRCDGPEPLAAIGVTMPPWTDPSACYPVEGPWPPTV